MLWKYRRPSLFTDFLSANCKNGSNDNFTLKNSFFLGSIWRITKETCNFYLMKNSLSFSEKMGNMPIKRKMKKNLERTGFFSSHSDNSFFSHMRSMDHFNECITDSDISMWCFFCAQDTDPNGIWFHSNEFKLQSNLC